MYEEEYTTTDQLSSDPQYSSIPDNVHRCHPTYNNLSINIRRVFSWFHCLERHDSRRRKSIKFKDLSLPERPLNLPWVYLQQNQNLLHYKLFDYDSLLFLQTEHKLKREIYQSNIYFGWIAFERMNLFIDRCRSSIILRRLNCSSRISRITNEWNFSIDEIPSDESRFFINQTANPFSFFSFLENNSHDSFHVVCNKLDLDLAVISTTSTIDIKW